MIIVVYYSCLTKMLGLFLIVLHSSYLFSHKKKSSKNCLYEKNIEIKTLAGKISDVHD